MSKNEFSGEKLRLARTFYGLTQQEVGEKIGVTRQFVHQIEIGARTPSEETVPGFCALFSVNPEFFFREIKNPVTVDETYFRKLKKTPVALVNQTLSFGTFANRLVNILEDFLNLPQVLVPNYDVKCSDDVPKVANAVRRDLGLKLDSPIRSVSQTIEKCGPIIFDFKHASSDLDALSISRARPIIIRSTTKQSGARLRFDFAHEFGHLVMHQGQNDHSDELEKQANRFAGCFIFPLDSLRREFPTPVSGKFEWKKIYQLKKRWGLSVAAIIRQAYDASLLNELEYQRANRYLSKTRQRKSEWYDDYIPIEEPELLRKSLKVLFDRNGIGILELANALDVRSDFLAKLVGFDESRAIESSASNVALLRKR